MRIRTRIRFPLILALPAFYTRNSFGLQNAPATIQRALVLNLFGVRWKKCLVYIDEFVIFPKNNHQQVKDIDEVQKLLPRL